MKNTLSREEVINILTGEADCSGDWLKIINDEKLKRLLKFWAIGLILYHEEFEACTAYRDTITANFLLKERKKLKLGTVSYDRKANCKEIEMAENFKEFYRMHIDKPYISHNVKEAAWKDVQKAFSDKWFSIGAKEYIEKCLAGEEMFNVNFALEPSEIIKNSELLKLV